MKQIKISILSISYNTADYVRKSIDSLLHQTLKEIEIIAIDNGSTDNSLAIFQEYARKDPRVKCYDMEECLGVQRDLGGVVGNTDYSACINYGLHLAQGEYVYILDCDDWLELHGLEVLYQRAKADNLDMIAFNPVVEYENQEVKEQYTTHSTYFGRKTPFDHVASGKEFMSSCEERGEHLVNVFLYLVKRSFIEEYRLRMNYFGGDILFTFQLYMTAKRVSLHNEALHHYLMRKKSGTEILHGNNDYACRRYQITYTEMLSLFFYHKCTKEKDVYLYRIMTKVLGYAMNHRKEDVFLGLTSLLQYESLILGYPLGANNCSVSKETLKGQRAEKKNLCLFGGGVMGKAALDFFKEHDMAPPCGICDTLLAGQGLEIEGIPVISLDEALERFENVHFLVTSVSWSVDIILQLVEKVDLDHIFHCDFLKEPI